jgi:hypothetical protein
MIVGGGLHKGGGVREMEEDDGVFAVPHRVDDRAEVRVTRDHHHLRKHIQRCGQKRESACRDWRKHTF